MSATFEQTNGPIPPPSMLERYNQVIPNGADRLMSMAERQADHRQALEKIVIDGDSKRANWGLVAGFVIAISFSGLATFLIVSWHSAEGVALFGLNITGVVGTFVYGSRQRQKERETASRQLQEPRSRR